MDPDATVRNFIDHESRTWREDILENSSLDLEASTTKKIPPCRTPQADTLTWPYNQNGDYSVKSAGYKFLQDEFQTQQPGSSTSDTSKPLWQAIWNLNVPGKVKNRLW